MTGKSQQGNPSGVPACGVAVKSALSYNTCDIAMSVSNNASVHYGEKFASFGFVFLCEQYVQYR